jgi:glycosyltransferase involved in cell wall biosynthesis
MTGKNLLAVVIITRNEARRINLVLTAILKAVRDLPGTDIMLVDSASTDGTVDIARQFPISIIQLRPDWPLTPGAGRYLGTLATSSEYILFLDGDSQIYSDWLPPALEFLRERPDAAGVGGTRDEFYVDEQGQLTGEVLHRYHVPQATRVNTLGGDGLYRRAALDKAGTFHPYLALYEEAELALRLRRAGYTLWRLPLPMVQDLPPTRGTIQEALRRFRVGFYPRAGRTLRATYKNGLAGQFTREFLMNYVMTSSYLLAGLICLLATLAGRRGWLIAWLAISVATFVVYSTRKRSVSKAFGNLVARMMVIYGLIAGFITGGQDANQYPTGVKIIQCQSELPLPPLPSKEAA